MADPEHLRILKEAVDKKDIWMWNQWRLDNPSIEPDLSYASLLKADLSFIGLNSVNLSNVSLMGANLSYADLYYANLSNANLIEANLSHATLLYANLSDADLTSVSFISSNIAHANLSNACVGNTKFIDVDLSVARHLDTLEIIGPCSIGIDTLYLSQKAIHEPWFDSFLQDCGVPQTLRVFAGSLVAKPVDYYSCFISYSTQDEEFCKELQSRLKHRGLHVWFAPEEMKGGRKIHEQLYEAIRYHDKLILVLSKASMYSNWVQLEIKRARKREKQENRQVLFPILLTSYEDLQSWELITSDGEDLAEEIRQYFIPDFTDWKNHDAFTQSVEKLVADLIKDDASKFY